MPEINSEDIVKLNDYQHVRLRENVYLGSKSAQTQKIIGYDDNGHPELVELTWVPALFTAFREILDNSLDELVGKGFGNKIDIEYDESNLTFTIRDNGRGIPIDYDSDNKMHKATLAMTEARAGRNFGDRGHVSGANGVGASVVIFSSEWAKLEIFRDSKKFIQEFYEGTPAIDRLQIHEPKISKNNSGRTGTQVSVKLSRQVFTDRQLPTRFIKDRIYEVALTNPLVKFTYNGEPIRVKSNIEKTIFKEDKPIVVDIKDKDTKTKFFLLPKFSDSEVIHSIVNNIPSFNGGVHIDNFRKFFYSGLLTALEQQSKRKKLTPTRADINEDLLIYNVTSIKAPNFDSYSKTKLINPEIGELIKTALESDKIFKDIIRKNSEWIEQIYERCRERNEKKDASEISKLSKRILRSRVASLLDANGKKREECILYITEGLSAAAGMAEVRNPTIHGSLPLRGKILNVNGQTSKKVLENEVLTDVINSLGLIIGQKAERERLRYGKVFITADSDEDGKSINSLVINFFYTFWPELFQDKKNPFIHVFSTPFIIADKGKETKYWYADNYEEFIPEKWKGWSVMRAKGLGSLRRQDWTHSLNHPESTPIIDDGKMKEALDLIFNQKRADDRKTWIGL